MKITDIKPAVKTPGRWNIFVDGKYSFSLLESQLLEGSVRIGHELSADELDNLKNDSTFGKAYARALELIMRRLRSEKELYDYARRKEWSDDIRDRVIEKLRIKGYIDDVKFAEAWVRSRVATKPSSRRKLELELRQKGVVSAIIESALQSDDSDHDELDALRRIVTKRRSRYSDPQKFMAYLARQGFSYDAIKHVLSEEDSES